MSNELLKYLRENNIKNNLDNYAKGDYIYIVGYTSDKRLNIRRIDNGQIVSREEVTNFINNN